MNPPGRGVTVDPSDGCAYLLHGENGLWCTDPAAFGTVTPSSPPRAKLLRSPGDEIASTLPTAAPRSLSTMAIHPADGDVLYVMGDRQDFARQLRKSTDRGCTWAAVSQPLPVKTQVVSRTLIFDSGDA